jgi:hypothetical protein
MSLILRNLPGGFVYKNYLCLVVGLPKRYYYLSAIFDNSLKIGFYCLIGNSINDLKSFFKGESLDQKERQKLFIFSIIFGIFLFIEILATIYSLV